VITADIRVRTLDLGGAARSAAISSHWGSFIDLSSTSKAAPVRTRAR
jgi:hypothetical protein